MEETKSNEVPNDQTENPSGITSNNNSSSSNFLGLLPPPYSMSTLKNSLPLLNGSQMSSSQAESNLNPSQTSTYTSRLPMRSTIDANHYEHYSNAMYRSSPSLSFSMPKAAIFHPTREKERLELSSLNDKFADYVEKVRYLEAQNKKIQMETSCLHEKQQESCQRVKSMFEGEMKQLKELIERIFKEKSITTISVKERQNSIPTLKQQLNQTFKDCDASKYETEKLERQLSAIEGDILMFERRLTHQDNENNQWKQFLTQLQRLQLQAKNEIHGELISRASLEQAIKQLRLDINKLREQQHQKLKDLQQTSLMIGSNSSNDRAHSFKSELSSAIRKVRQDFERQNELQRQELYTQFTQSYEEIARQNPELGHLFLSDREQDRIRQEEDRLRFEIQRLRTDCNVIKQKNAEIKLHIREYQINLEMSTEENTRIEQLQENEINQLKVRHEKISKDYDDVISKQTSLEKEIETYRNLLEGTMKPVVDTITDEYQATVSNPPRSKPPTSGLTSRTTRSLSADRSSAAPFLSKKTDTNFYSSLINCKYDSKPTIDSSMTVIDIPILDQSESNKTKMTDDIKDSEQQTTEKTESVNSSPVPNRRPPIVLQTRRNN